MTKRPILSVAICFLFGLIFSLRECYWIIIPTIILEVYIFLQLKKYDMSSRGLMLSGLLFVTFLLGLARGKIDVSLRNRTDIIDDGQMVVVQGRLCKKETKNQKNYLYLDESRILLDGSSFSCGDVLLLTDNTDYVLGNTLVVKGKNRKFERARNEGNYDEESVYFSKGIYLKIDSVTLVSEHGKEETLLEYLYILRERMKTVIEKNLTEENAGVLSSVVLGDRTSLLVEDRESYAKAGLSHILSVSGLHVSLLCLGFYKLLRRTRIRQVIAMPIVSAFSVLYCAFSGAGISTIRAVGMFNISLIAMAFGESYDLLCSLALLAMIIAFKTPETIFSAGYLLSFSAVIGIAVSGQILSDYYEGISRRRNFIRKRRRDLSKRKEKEVVKRIRTYMEDFEKMLLVNVGIIITTLPFVSWFYYEVPSLSLIVNILVIPLMGVLLGLGFIGSLLGAFISPCGFLIKPCGYICEFYRVLARFTDRISFSKIVIGRPAVLGIIFYYLLLAIFLYYLFLRTKNMDSYQYKEVAEVNADVEMFKMQNLIFLLATVAGSVFLSCVLLLSNVKKPCIKMLDVGQGDGIYLRTKSGRDVFVDGGSSSIKQIGKYRIEPFLKYSGVGTIDYWFVSHTDEDHVSGLVELLENGYRVENIVLSKFITKDENYGRIKSLCGEHEINMIFLDLKDELICGEEKFVCVYPMEKGGSTNDNSLVILYDATDFYLFLTGDIGKEQERQLMNIWDIKRDDKMRILKVAHHGSKNSSEESFVEWFNPDISLISAGKNNSYGHPHKETIDKLENINSIIRRTDEEGEIIITRE